MIVQKISALVDATGAWVGWLYFGTSGDVLLEADSQMSEEDARLAKVPVEKSERPFFLVTFKGQVFSDLTIEPCVSADDRKNSK